jgi:hypothetical protein
MEITGMNWRKSSYSGTGGSNCTEVATDHDNRVLVRDTHHPNGPVLRFTPAAWRRFADHVKRSLAPAALRSQGTLTLSESDL